MGSSTHVWLTGLVAWEFGAPAQHMHAETVSKV